MRSRVWGGGVEELAWGGGVRSRVWGGGCVGGVGGRRGRVGAVDGVGKVGGGGYEVMPMYNLWKPIFTIKKHCDVYIWTTVT